jgi:predicted ATPase/DNA-binding XRE family transcriptional regulator
MGAERPVPFGQLLREFRVAAALTQEELAEEAGLSLRGISDLERGARRSPHPATVRRIAVALRLAGDDRAALEAAARPPRGVPLPRSAESSRGRHGSLTSFVGRDKEQAEVVRLLGTRRLVTLTGVGGIGKTRLALAVARSALPEHVEKAIVVELAALADPLLVALEVAAAVGVPEDAGRPILDMLSAALADQRVLVVLDNCEHLLAACAELAERLLSSTARLRILATSREPLHVPNETTWPVPPLAVGDEEAASVDRLARYGAVRLFEDRARAVWPTFELSENNASVVARVCRRLDGIPLAIELAAARTRVLSVEQIDARLEDRYRLLVWGAATAPPRHQTLLATVDWSYALLSDAERLLFDRLSVFRGGVSLEAVEAVCKLRETPAEMADVLQSLVEKSLVVADPQADGTVRFGQLETLREYAYARLVDRDEADALHSRHLRFQVGLAERAEVQLRGPEQLVWLDRLERDHDNVRAALAWAEQRDSAREDGLRLAGAIWFFWLIRGHVAEGCRWFAGLLATTAQALPDPRTRAKALTGAGALAFQMVDYDRSVAYHEEGLALYRQLDDKRGIATVLSGLAVVTSGRGESARALVMFCEVLDLSLRIDDRPAAANALANLGITARGLGQLDQARDFDTRALDMYRELGNRGARANVIHSLGNVALDRGDLVEASSCFREALAMAHEHRDWGVVARCIEGLASIMAAQQHQPARAAQLLGAVERLREEIGIAITSGGRARYDGVVALVKSSLSGAEFAAAWKRGRGQSRERAIKLALG